MLLIQTVAITNNSEVLYKNRSKESWEVYVGGKGARQPLFIESLLNYISQSPEKMSVGKLSGIL